MEKDFFEDFLAKNGITRREFLKYSAATSAALALPGLMQACSHSCPVSQGQEETRTYYFDLAHGDPDHDYYVFIGGKMHKLETISTAAHYRQAIKNNPLLQLLPRERVTHVKSNISVADDAIGLCYVMSADPNSTDGSWTMPMIFYQLPTAALCGAATKLASEQMKGGLKWNLYGVQSEAAKLMVHPFAYRLEDDIKTPFDHAVALTFSHPEMLAAVPESAAYIQKKIIAQQVATENLAWAIQSQGTASEQEGGWATLVPLRDPDTNEIIYNPYNGKKQYHTSWSDLTTTVVGDSIKPSMVAVKSDSSLGANITGYSPDDDHPELYGKIWKVYDGTESIPMTTSAPVTYKFKKDHADHGYHAELDSVTIDSSGYTLATIKVRNWYARYLSIYVRFRGPDGSVKKLSELPDDIQRQFPKYISDLNSENDLFAVLLSAEMELFSIPIKSAQKTIGILIPDSVSYIDVMAGGIGRSGNVSTDKAMVVKPGVVATAIVNLTVPSIFLATMAATAYCQWALEFSMMDEISLLANLIVDVVFGSIVDINYGDPDAFKDVVNKVTTYLLTKGGWVYKSITAAVGEGEATNAIPIVGVIMTAVAAATLLSALGQTIGEVCTSEKIYTYTLSRTHDITLTINNDPADPAGLPETATHYLVTLILDQGTPQTIRFEMPATTVKSVTCTLENIPYGGNITVSVDFLSDTEYCVGTGTTGRVDNTVDQLAITIREILVPLTTDTEYHHKEITYLDDNQQLQWDAAPAPTENITDLSCENIAGELCQLGYITVSELTTSVGYSWKSYCGSPASGQFFQIANMDFGENPNSGHRVPDYQFPGMVPMVYSLEESTTDNFYVAESKGKYHVRQIRLSLNQQPDYDGPDSNRSFGYFQYPPDGLVLHSAGKLISINANSHNMEVLDITEAFTDDEAPAANIYSMEGSREGLMNGPICVTIAKRTTILVLESGNQRIQAFDTSGNPVPYFNGGKDYFVPLKADANAQYLGFVGEHQGYLYVLSYVSGSTFLEYYLDLYDPDGNFLSRTSGVNAGNIAVDLWRNVLTLNYRKLMKKDGTLPFITEPSVSKWVPSTPKPGA